VCCQAIFRVRGDECVQAREMSAREIVDAQLWVSSRSLGALRTDVVAADLVAAIPRAKLPLAWRRLVTDAEVASLMTLFNYGFRLGGTTESRPLHERCCIGRQRTVCRFVSRMPFESS
jgi:hypothetical protein